MIDPKDYWVNNPLITPVNKALMYDDAIFNAAEDEKKRIIKMLEGWSCGLDDCPEWRVNSEKVIEFCNTRNSLIALIKGEK